MNKRNYKQNCSLALASDLLCERWTLLIFRELLIQPCRYKQLSAYLEGMGSNLLSQRLKELEHGGLIEKQDPTDKRSAYQLTTNGIAAEPLILELIRWGHGRLAGKENYKHYHHWDLLALKALFQPSKFNKSIRLQIDSPELCAWISASNKGLVFELNSKKAADVEIDCSLATLRERIKAGEKLKPVLLREFIAAVQV